MSRRYRINFNFSNNWAKAEYNEEII